jgi:hypothetical protein
MARPFIADPEIARKLISGEIDTAPTPEKTLEIGHLMQWFSVQIDRMGDGLMPDRTLEGAAASEQFVNLETGYMTALLEQRAHERSVAA